MSDLTDGSGLWNLKSHTNLKSVFFFLHQLALGLAPRISFDEFERKRAPCVGVRGARFLAYLGRDGVWKQLHAH